MNKLMNKQYKMESMLILVTGYTNNLSGENDLILSSKRARSLATILVPNNNQTKIVFKGLGVAPHGSSKLDISLSRKAEIWIQLNDK